MATVALFGKRIPDEARPFVERALETLKEEGAKILMHDRLQKQLNERWGLAIDHDTFHDEKDFSDKSPDFLISIGGDGTLLDATTLVERTDVPIIGLNTGRLGFLANIARDEASDAIRQVLKGQYTLDPRYCMEVSPEGGSQTIQPNFALNELTVSRKGTTSMISIHVYVTGQFLNTYWAD
ncbi:MAG: NAD(+)/NADH kinase, partial [Schleiferiaceae bacterium]|nr:NAD(+)/NADH kinase [Schleiferiaceae bacterium]